MVFHTITGPCASRMAGTSAPPAPEDTQKKQEKVDEVQIKLERAEDRKPDKIRLAVPCGIHETPLYIIYNRDAGMTIILPFINRFVFFVEGSGIHGPGPENPVIPQILQHSRGPGCHRRP